MSQENAHKIKLLKLTELLQSETDEQHPMRTSELCARLEEMGIPCERRTLARDIEVLNNWGTEVMYRMVGHEKGYYIEDRSFSIPELRILMDAVQAATFVTDKKTAELIDKIAALGGSHRAELLKSSLVRFNTRKHRNESIYYNVDSLERALRSRCKASFYYFDLDENGCRAYRRDKDRYVVEPLALVFREDNYYLVCYDAHRNEYNDVLSYRVDRMESVEAEETAISEAARDKMDSRELSEYIEQTFRMFGGRTKNVVLAFDSSLIGAIYDKFGEDTKIKRIDENICIATVRVQISPTFHGWLYQFGDKMRMLTPDDMTKL